MKHLSIFCAVLFMGILSLQAQQIENASFENWENAGTVIDEPVNWSSIKTSDGGAIINNAAPVIWGKSTDAHTGSFSVELTNVLTLGTIVATGIMTNGRVHAEFNPGAGYVFTDSTNAGWSLPMSSRPDSIVVWAKYTPQGTDTAQVKVLLHSNAGTLPPTPANLVNWVGFAQINISGTVGSWTRYSMPFNYLSPAVPQFLLMILTSGAGTNGVQGSMARFDDIELIYNSNNIAEPDPEKGLVYTTGHTLCFDKLPRAWFNNAQVEVRSLTGSLVFSAPLEASRMTMNSNALSDGLYILSIHGRDASYVQKLFLH